MFSDDQPVMFRAYSAVQDEQNGRSMKRAELQFDPKACDGYARTFEWLWNLAEWN
jgi:hypothetical protein